MSPDPTALHRFFRAEFAATRGGKPHDAKNAIRANHLKHAQIAPNTWLVAFPSSAGGTSELEEDLNNHLPKGVGTFRTVIASKEDLRKLESREIALEE